MSQAFGARFGTLLRMPLRHRWVKSRCTWDRAPAEYSRNCAISLVITRYSRAVSSNRRRCSVHRTGSNGDGRMYRDIFLEEVSDSTNSKTLPANPFSVVANCGCCNHTCNHCATRPLPRRPAMSQATRGLREPAEQHSEELLRCCAAPLAYCVATPAEPGQPPERTRRVSAA